jgi:hypothetical protein
MKLFFIFLFTSIAPPSIYSQQNFEGMISYEGHSTGGIQMEVQMYFGKHAMKSVTVTRQPESEDSISEINISDFGKKVGYVLRTEDHSYSKFSLTGNQQAASPGMRKTAIVKTILGQPCTQYIMDTKIGEAAILPDSLVMDIHSEIYYTNDLVYLVPPAYRSQFTSIIPDDGNLIYLSVLYFMKKETSDNHPDTFYLEATKIIHGSYPDSFFELPAGYVLLTEANDGVNEINAGSNKPIKKKTVLKSPASKEKGNKPPLKKPVTRPPAKQ